MPGRRSAPSPGAACHRWSPTSAWRGGSSLVPPWPQSGTNPPPLTRYTAVGTRHMLPLRSCLNSGSGSLFSFRQFLPRRPRLSPSVSGGTANRERETPLPRGGDARRANRRGEGAASSPRLPASRTGWQGTPQCNLNAAGWRGGVRAAEERNIRRMG